MVTSPLDAPPTNYNADYIFMGHFKMVITMNHWNNGQIEVTGVPIEVAWARKTPPPAFIRGCGNGVSAGSAAAPASGP